MDYINSLKSEISGGAGMTKAAACIKMGLLLATDM
jgi:hypothetical protein